MILLMIFVEKKKTNLKLGERSTDNYSHISGKVSGFFTGGLVIASKQVKYRIAQSQIKIKLFY